MAMDYNSLQRGNSWSTDQKRVIRKLFDLAFTAADPSTSATISRTVVNQTLAGKLDAGEEQDFRSLFIGLRKAIDDAAGVDYTDLQFADAGPDTITTIIGDFTEFVTAGDTIVVVGSVSNDGSYLVDSVTATVITLDSGEALSNEGTADVSANISRDGTVYDLQPHFTADRWTGNQRKIIKALAQTVVDAIAT